MVYLKSVTLDVSGRRVRKVLKQGVSFSLGVASHKDMHQ